MLYVLIFNYYSNFLFEILEPIPIFLGIAA